VAGDAKRRQSEWAALLAGSTLFIVAAIVWQIVVSLGVMPPKLFPSLVTVAHTFIRLALNGVLLAATLATLYRLLLGFALAAIAGMLVGGLMGRYKWVEDTLLPIVSFFYPIPGIAYAPLFVLWFGLGDMPAILLVGFSSSFTVAFNTWKGVTTVKSIWVRSAQAMGAREADLFRKVIMPASLPYVLIGLRLGLASSWRILIAVEMLTSVARGLGWMIFGAQQFLDTDVMLATIAVIGLIGVLLENQVFTRLERMTVVRWGMVAA